MRNYLVLLSCIVVLGIGCHVNPSQADHNPSPTQPQATMPQNPHTFANADRSASALAKLGLYAAKCVGGFVAGAMVGVPLSHAVGATIRIKRGLDVGIGTMDNILGQEDYGAGRVDYHLLGIEGSNDGGFLPTLAKVPKRAIKAIKENITGESFPRPIPWEFLAASAFAVAGCVGASLL